MPDYMEGDLETAVTPTPQRAELDDTVFAAGKVLVVKPDRYPGYPGPETLFDELRALLGGEAVTVVSASEFSPPQADTVIFIGKLQGKNVVLLAGNSPAAPR